MRVTRVGLRDFRNYEAAEVELAEGLTVVAGPNGSGKTNLLEGRLLRLHGALAANLERARARAPRGRRRGARRARHRG